MRRRILQLSGTAAVLRHRSAPRSRAGRDRRRSRRRGRGDDDVTGPAARRGRYSDEAVPRAHRAGAGAGWPRRRCADSVEHRGEPISSTPVVQRHQHVPFRPHQAAVQHAGRQLPATAPAARPRRRRRTAARAAPPYNAVAAPAKRSTTYRLASTPPSSPPRSRTSRRRRSADRRASVSREALAQPPSAGSASSPTGPGAARCAPAGAPSHRHHRAPRAACCLTCRAAAVRPMRTLGSTITSAPPGWGLERGQRLLRHDASRRWSAPGRLRRDRGHVERVRRGGIAYGTRSRSPGAGLAQQHRRGLARRTARRGRLQRRAARRARPPGEHRVPAAR